MYRKKMIYATIVVTILLSTLLSSSYAGNSLPVDQPDASPTPSATSTVSHFFADENGVQFRLNTPSYILQEDGTIAVDGLDNRIRQPGAPALPRYTTLIALPPGATVTVGVQEKQRLARSVDAIPPVPQPDLSYEGDAIEAFAPYTQTGNGNPKESPPPLVSQPDAAIYARNAAYPGTVYTVSEPLYYRDMRLVRLHLYPLRYNPVTNRLYHARQLNVVVSFQGGTMANLRPSPTPNHAQQKVLAATVLNYEQAKAWRSLPQPLYHAPASPLPSGTATYKIEINRDGIYEISGADLATAGMDIAAVNPDTIEMMHRGQPVAYQFIDNGLNNDTFDADEKIRFYGWAFDGPRTEKQFVLNNVFWLWAGGTPTAVSSKNNETGHPATTSYLATITKEPENHFFSTWTNKWDTFPNEPDAWYWDYIRKTTLEPITKTYTVDLPAASPEGSEATYTVEVTSRANLTTLPHTVHAYLNDNDSFGTQSWFGRQNVNITNTVPITDLVGGANQVKVVYATGTLDQLYLNRISVTYRRRLRAVGNQLIFSDDAGGAREFSIEGFSESDAGQVVAWDIGDPANPVEITMNSSHISGSNPYTYTVGSTHSAGARFIVTTQANFLTAADLPAPISQYIPADLEPDNGQAEWLAITHEDFITEANRLAAHRASADFGGLQTHVVDIDHIINQYGYGLPLPAAVRGYLAHALDNWSVAPSYVAMIGDATMNPRHLGCPTYDVGGGCSTWDKDEPTYVMTDMVFEDRFQGIIPSDYTFVLLVGDDLLPDMAIGRIAAATAPEAAQIIDKIIQYEQNLLNVDTNTWLQNVLFVADDPDSGGNFCSANENTATFIPDTFRQTHLCLPPSPEQADVDALRTEMGTHVNDTGLSYLNYRGHGSRVRWADEEILSTETIDFWTNSGKPAIILSADCLDGFFAWPGLPGLGETFLKLADVGSAAHWSSTGLGYTDEHTALHTGFYEGVYDMDLTAIGDAINYAKVRYDTRGYHQSELYSFILQGDPAMPLPQLSEPFQIFLPTILKP